MLCNPKDFMKAKELDRDLKADKPRVPAGYNLEGTPEGKILQKNVPSVRKATFISVMCSFVNFAACKILLSLVFFAFSEIRRVALLLFGKYLFLFLVNFSCDFFE